MIIILEDYNEKYKLLESFNCPEESGRIESCTGIKNFHDCFECVKYNYGIKITFAKIESK